MQAFCACPRSAFRLAASVLRDRTALSQAPQGLVSTGPASRPQNGFSRSATAVTRGPERSAGAAKRLDGCGRMCARQTLASAARTSGRPNPRLGVRKPHLFGWSAAGGQMLSCVRPHALRHIPRRGPVWRYAGRVQACARRLGPNLISPRPVRLPDCQRNRRLVAQAAGAAARYSVFLVSSAQTMRPAGWPAPAQQRGLRASGQPGVLVAPATAQSHRDHQQPPEVALAHLRYPAELRRRRSNAAAVPGPAKPQSPSRSSPAAARRPVAIALSGPMPGMLKPHRLWVIARPRTQFVPSPAIRSSRAAT